MENLLAQSQTAILTDQYICNYSSILAANEYQYWLVRLLIFKYMLSKRAKYNPIKNYIGNRW